MSERRLAIQSRLREETGIDDAMIERVVRVFYAKAREDALLGPVFASRIRDWEPHLQAIRDFWSSVTLMSGAYHGQPMTKHLDLMIDARHFDRWLALFEETTRATCPPPAADRFVLLARRVAKSLRLSCERAPAETSSGK